MTGDDSLPQIPIAFPCPWCSFDCREQARNGTARCPECGGELPEVRGIVNAYLSWTIKADLMTRQKA